MSLASQFLYMMLRTLRGPACGRLKPWALLALILTAVLAPAQGLNITIPLQRDGSSLGASSLQRLDNVLVGTVQAYAGC